jgi:acyl-coenzyme A synthetase/AMP-(fatty) acid ligase
VGGYRVNPYEVEKFINSLDSVHACAVSSEESSVTGNVPVAIVQPKETVDHADVMQSVREAISGLEPWKKPRKIKIVDELRQTRSGKKER